MRMRRIYPRTRRARLVRLLLAERAGLTVDQIAQRLDIRPVQIRAMLETLRRDHDISVPVQPVVQLADLERAILASRLEKLVEV